jgi:hypothetical protein
VILFSIVLAATPVADSSVRDDFAVYKSEQHSILINWRRRLMSIWPSGVRLHFTQGAMAFQPQNLREWSDRGVCGIETPAWTFVIPAAGSNETRYGRWRFVADSSSPAHRESRVSVYEYRRGRIFTFSYNSKVGIDRLTIGGGAFGRPERFVLTRGVGLLHDCIQNKRAPDDDGTHSGGS